LKNEYLAVNPVNGLANRLRVIFSYKLLAEFLDVPYYVHWNSGIGFDETKLDNLIVCDELDLICHATWNNLVSESFSLSDNIAGLYEGDIKSNLEIKRDHCINKIFNKSYKKITTVASNYLPWSFGEDIVSSFMPHFKKEYNNLVSEIKPTKEINQLAQKTLSAFQNDCIGVHIRRGDALSEKNINHKMHNDLVIETTIRYLKEKTNQFFLCTDDEIVNQKFHSIFGDRCLSYEKKFQSSKIEEKKMGQTDAMVDLFLLSSTKKILATSPSSFAKFASLMGAAHYYSTNEIIQSTGNSRKMLDIIKS